MDLAEEGGPLDEQTKKVLDDLDVLLAMQEAKRRQLSGGMMRSFDSLKFFVLYLGMALVAVGIIRGLPHRARHRQTRARAPRHAAHIGPRCVPSCPDRQPQR